MVSNSSPTVNASGKYIDKEYFFVDIIFFAEFHLLNEPIWI